MEMQQTSWAIDKIRLGSFKIDMCFSYGDDDGEILQWCQGTVTKILKEERTFAIVQIKVRGGKTCIIWPKRRKITK